MRGNEGNLCTVKQREEIHDGRGKRCKREESGKERNLKRKNGMKEMKRAKVEGRNKKATNAWIKKITEYGKNKHRLNEGEMETWTKKRRKRGNARTHTSFSTVYGMSRQKRNGRKICQRTIKWEIMTNRWEMETGERITRIRRRDNKGHDNDSTRHTRGIKLTNLYHYFIKCGDRSCRSSGGWSPVSHCGGPSHAI
jgi:hypothetical protein